MARSGAVPRFGVPPSGVTTQSSNQAILSAVEQAMLNSPEEPGIECPDLEHLPFRLVKDEGWNLETWIGVLKTSATLLESHQFEAKP
jgi:hypothetical protein